MNEKWFNFSFLYVTIGDSKSLVSKMTNFSQKITLFLQPEMICHGSASLISSTRGQVRIWPDIMIHYFQSFKMVSNTMYFRLE